MSAQYYVYRNLRIENTFSVRFRGRVVDRLTDFVARNVRFQVSEVGRLRVLRERQKNVHAFVRAREYEPFEFNGSGMKQISYNPYRASTFMCDGEPIMKADVVLFRGGKCYLVE
jgi:hypothetical protein